MPLPAPADATVAPPREPDASAGVDWAARGAELRERVRAGGLWRDPQLTLAKLAGELGVSAGSITRALNDGLEQNFSETINRMRVAAVEAQLTDPAERRDVLDLALDAGFSSKASCNRNFKAYTGRTPSQVRAEVVRGEIGTTGEREPGVSPSRSE